MAENQLPDQIEQLLKQLSKERSLVVFRAVFDELMLTLIRLCPIFASRIQDFRLDLFHRLDRSDPGVTPPDMEIRSFVEGIWRISVAGPPVASSPVSGQPPPPPDNEKTESLWSLTLPPSWSETRASVPRRPRRAKPSTSSTKDAHLFTVWYGTNRRPLEASGVKGYSGDREDDPQTIHYGTCVVNIPQSHRFGELGSRWLKRWVRGDDDRLTLRTILPLGDSSFWAKVKGELDRQDPTERQALIYIHGYNVDFQAAAIRAAQIGFDLKVPGAMAFFSWPSRGLPDQYMADEATIEASESAISSFLIHWAKMVDAERLHVIAHSMGNRGLLRAMQRIQANAARYTRARFGQIFLAAPDVDANLFCDLATLYPQLSARTTLYVSPADRAVELSRWLHGAARAGFTPPVTIVKGIDTVDVPGFDLTSLGHSYFAEAEGVLHDMFDLLRHGAPPEERQRLRKMRLIDGRVYWAFQA